MNTMKVYQEIALSFNAYQTCKKNNNDEWLEKHETRILEIVKNFLPSGSGLDSGIKLNFDESTTNKLVFDSSYHCMNNNGYYDGWADFKLFITPDLSFGFNTRISGKFGKYADTKDYLHTIFRNALNTEIKVLYNKETEKWTFETII